MKVHIRKRLNSAGDKYNLALEVYLGYSVNENGNSKPKRVTTKLEYFLYVNPKIPQQKNP